MQSTNMHLYLAVANLKFKFDYPPNSEITLSINLFKYALLNTCFMLAGMIFLPVDVSAQENPKGLILMNGQILTSDSLLPVHNAHIISKNNKWGSISDEEGRVKIYVDPHDSLLITSVGFAAQVLYIHDSIIDKIDDNYTILLEKDTVLINEVLIRAFYDYETFKQLVINMKPLSLDQFYPDWEGTELLYMQPTPIGLPFSPVQALYNWLNKDARLQRQLIRNRKNYNRLMHDLNRDSDTIPAIPEHMQELPH